MSIEHTLSIIKPDAVSKNGIGSILARFEGAGLRIIACKMQQLSIEKAEGFYNEHRERPFFRDLIKFMISGPVVLQVLAGDDAISLNRNLMGATNPQEAEPGTIRSDFAASIDANVAVGITSSNTD